MLTGDEIRQARLRAGWSQAQLAELVGVSMRSIGNYERGETIPRNKMPKIEDALSAHTGGDGPSLAGASDAQLVTELANRLARTRKESEVVHDEQEANQAPTNRAGGSPAKPQGAIDLDPGVTTNEAPSTQPREDQESN